jgi:multicomponent K+:H+ antiporter subunit G
MSELPEISVIPALLTAVLLVAGAAITLVGALGLVRLQTFYQRVHPPTLGTTLGVSCVALASMIYFSALGTRPILHEVLIVIFVTVTTPVTLTILVRAASLRDQSSSSARRNEH